MTLPFQIRIKNGAVNMVGHPRLMHGLFVLCRIIYEVGGVVPVITSIWDQTHGENSLHYIGCAADVRSHYLTESEKDEVLRRAREELGDEYDLLLHPRGAPSEHFHLEFDVAKYDRQEAVYAALGAA